VPRRLVARAVARFISVLYARDVAQDFRIWEHKRCPAKPALARATVPWASTVGGRRKFYGGEQAEVSRGRGAEVFSARFGRLLPS